MAPLQLSLEIRGPTYLPISGQPWYFCFTEQGGWTVVKALETDSGFITGCANSGKSLHPLTPPRLYYDLS